MKKLLTISILTLFVSISLHSQDRIVVLPFYNMDGKEALNEYCDMLADSLSNCFIKDDPDELNYRIIPKDSVDLALEMVNYKPNTASALDDMWKAVELLNCERVVLGELQMQGKNLLLNVMIYDVKTRLPSPHQVRNLFFKPKKISKVVPKIGRKLREGILGN